MQGTRNFPRIFRRIKMGETITTNQRKKETYDWRRTILGATKQESRPVYCYLPNRGASGIPGREPRGEENLSQPESHPREPMPTRRRRGSAKAMSSAYDITPIVVGAFYRINRRGERRNFCGRPFGPWTSPHRRQARYSGDSCRWRLRLLLESDCFEHVRIAKDDPAPVSLFAED
jgi:hypothetical protein